jgi:hypothetical protein
MDKDQRLHGETSTVRTNDRGEISGKPVGVAENDEATSEELIAEHDPKNSAPPRRNERSDRSIS